MDKAHNQKRGNEGMFIVSKELSYEIACDEATKYFGSVFNRHCANFNDEWGRFGYEGNRQYAKDNYVFIGRI